MFSVPLLGIRPKKAEIWGNGQRVCQIVLPPGTRNELAERAVREGIQRWVERLDTKQYLKLTSDIDIEGPYFCPFAENYGMDMWLAKGWFTAQRPRLVREDVVVGQRRLAEDVGMGYQEFRTAAEPGLPDDYREQLDFVKQNADEVYDQLRETERIGKEIEDGERQGV